MTDESSESWGQRPCQRPVGLDSGPESVKGRQQRLKTMALPLSLFCLETMACLESLLCSFFQNTVDDAIV